MSDQDLLKCDYLLDLPEEILLYILTLCNPERKAYTKFLSYSYVSKYFNQLCCDIISYLSISVSQTYINSLDPSPNIDNILSLLADNTQKNILKNNFNHNILISKKRDNNILSNFRKIQSLSLNMSFHIPSNAILSLNQLQTLSISNIIGCSNSITKLLESLSNRLESLHLIDNIDIKTIPNSIIELEKIKESYIYA